MEKIDDFFKGWIVGDFDPALVKTKEVEIGVKKYSKGEKEEAHYHELATEWTCVISGKISMNGKIYVEGEIAKVEPGNSNEFLAIEDSITLVVKSPSIKGDKYFI